MRHTFDVEQEGLVMDLQEKKRFYEVILRWRKVSETRGRR